MRQTEQLPDQTQSAQQSVSFEQQYSTLPAPTLQGEPYPDPNIYPTESGASVYPPGINASMMGNAPMLGVNGRDFNQPDFPPLEHGKVYHQDQDAWQSGPASEMGYPSVSGPSVSMGIPPQEEMRPPEFLPNLESGAHQSQLEGHYPA